VDVCAIVMVAQDKNGLSRFFCRSEITPEEFRRAPEDLAQMLAAPMIAALQQEAKKAEEW
jgi:hypothetical protein